MEQILPFIIVCPLVFVAGFVDSIAGGGGLISLPAYLIAGLPVHNALGTNKLGNCMGTALAAWRYARKGFMEPVLCVACTLFALAGASGGASLAMLVDDTAFKWIMLFVIPLTAAYIMSHRAFREGGDELPRRRAVAICAAVSLGLGVYDGFYGPGTGTFLTLLFMSLAHLKLQEATGTCKVVNLATNVAALVVFLANGVVLLPLGLAAGAFNMLGAYIGTNFFMDKGVRATRPIMLAVLAVFFVKVLSELLGW